MVVVCGNRKTGEGGVSESNGQFRVGTDVPNDVKPRYRSIEKKFRGDFVAGGGFHGDSTVDSSILGFARLARWFIYWVS